MFVVYSLERNELLCLVDTSVILIFIEELFLLRSVVIKIQNRKKVEMWNLFRIFFTRSNYI